MTQLTPPMTPPPPPPPPPVAPPPQPATPPVPPEHATVASGTAGASDGDGRGELSAATAAATAAVAVAAVFAPRSVASMVLCTQQQQKGKRGSPSRAQAHQVVGPNVPSAPYVAKQHQTARRHQVVQSSTKRHPTINTSSKSHTSLRGHPQPRASLCAAHACAQLLQTPRSVASMALCSQQEASLTWRSMASMALWRG